MVVIDQSPDTIRLEELPCYVDAPSGDAPDHSSPRRHWRWVRSALSASPASSAISAAPVTMAVSTEGSACFSRILDLPAPHLPAVLHQWWQDGAGDGAIVLQHRLRLGPPRAERGLSWSMQGRLTRSVCGPAVSVLLELWPHNSRWTRLLLTPQARIVTSRRYFRLGHSILDGLIADLMAVEHRIDRPAAARTGAPLRSPGPDWPPGPDRREDRTWCTLG